MATSARRVLDPASATALILGSQLFDEQWYSDQCWPVGRAFDSREEAVAHWVQHAAVESSPHPLFEPLWLYPKGRWRQHAPDPLSFYLSRPDETARSPHPLVDLAVTGPLDAWLATHLVDEILSPPLAKAPPDRVSVLVQAKGLPRAVAWMRHLHLFSPDVLGVIEASGVGALRILTSVSRAMPSIGTQEAGAGLEPQALVSVVVGPAIKPPRWEWLPDLLVALERRGVTSAQSLLLNADFTVAAAGASYTPVEVVPLLAGHPLADAERIAHLPLPGAWPGVVATRNAVPADATVLVTSSRLITSHLESAPTSPASPGALERTDAVWRAAGFEGPNARPLRIREGRRALRWSIDIAAGPRGTRWGDFHFATSLAAALDRLGQWVAIDHPETRDRASRGIDDVVLTIRGLDRVVPQPGTVNVLWVISHPGQVTAEEATAYDAVFAASTAWAAERSSDWGFPVVPLLQCTDVTRFHPGLAEPDSGPRILFVGNSRGVFRPSVAAAVETGTPVTVFGSGWDDRVKTAGEQVPNESLGALYASAGLVLNDHWDDMREAGFASNRIFDVLATGARLLSDDVAGLENLLAADGLGAVATWRSTADFARLTAEPFEGHYPDSTTRLSVAERVVAKHSFDARAATLLEAALGLVDSRP